MSNRITRIAITFLRVQRVLFVWIFIWFYDNDDDAFSEDLKFNATFFVHLYNVNISLYLAHLLFSSSIFNTEIQAKWFSARFQFNINETNPQMNLTRSRQFAWKKEILNGFDSHLHWFNFQFVYHKKNLGEEVINALSDDDHISWINDACFLSFCSSFTSDGTEKQECQEAVKSCKNAQTIPH